MSPTFSDLFCGAGGSSTGLVAAGWDLKLAMNHSKIAISSHSANHPDAEHLCADINNYDMRRLPKTEALWASPICTEISPAGGRKRTKGQLTLDLEEYGPVEAAAWERTRATAYDVIRATEVHRYKAVLCENVVEFAADWELFGWWRSGMELLGYNSQTVSVSSAHVGGQDNPHAPQWRDRIYIVFTKKGIPLPDLKPRPLAWCPDCGDNIAAVQTWRNGRKIGKYKQQYDYRCPNTPCRHRIVEPYVRPAASAIDWTNLGTRIGDRSKPLAENTLRRIRAGLAQYPAQRTVLTVNHSGHDGRAFPADVRPLPARTIKIGDGVLVPSGGTPFVIEYRRNGTAEPVAHPLATVTAGGNHHGFVVPDGAFYIKNYGGNARPEDMARSITEPFGTVTVKDHHSLVIPQYAAAPREGERGPVPVVEDCYFRMLQPREQLLAQRFPKEYIVHGTKGEQTMQAGNAVSCNVAQWVGERVKAVL